MKAEGSDDDCDCGEEPVCWTMCLGDENNDGVITFDEAMLIAGHLTPEEEKIDEGMVHFIFDAIDTDGSGEVTPDELVNMFYIYLPIIEGIYEICGEDEECWGDAFQFLGDTAEECKEDAECWRHSFEELMYGEEDRAVEKSDIVGIRAIYELEPKRVPGYSGYLGWCTSIEGGEPKPRVNKYGATIQDCADWCSDEQECMGFQFSP